MSIVIYPSMSELQSKAKPYKLALNWRACVPTAMYLSITMVVFSLFQMNFLM